MKDRIMNEMLTYRAVLVDVILKHTGTGLGTGRPVNTPMPDSIDEDLCEPVAIWEPNNLHYQEERRTIVNLTITNDGELDRLDWNFLFEILQCELK